MALAGWPAAFQPLPTRQSTGRDDPGPLKPSTRPHTHQRSSLHEDPAATATQQGPQHSEHLHDHYPDQSEMAESEVEEPELRDPPIHISRTPGNSMSFLQMNSRLSETLNEQKATISTLLFIVMHLEKKARRTTRQPTLSPTYYNDPALGGTLATPSSKVAELVRLFLLKIIQNAAS